MDVAVPAPSPSSGHSAGSWRRHPKYPEASTALNLHTQVVRKTAPRDLTKVLGEREAAKKTQTNRGRQRRKRNHEQNRWEEEEKLKQRNWSLPTLFLFLILPAPPCICSLLELIYSYVPFQIHHNEISLRLKRSVRLQNKMNECFPLPFCFKKTPIMPSVL